MSIICFSFCDVETPVQNYPEGAYCLLGEEGKVHSDCDRHIVLWEEYKGKCIAESEKNGYHDSDFYMTVWDDITNSPKTILFATTRGWSYPSYASYVDATDEVFAKFERYKHMKLVEAQKTKRNEKAVFLWKQHSEDYVLCKKIGCSINKIRKLRTFQNGEAAIKLLTSNLRSDFRKNLKKQLVNWLVSKENIYNSPFSPRQWDFV